MRKFNTHRNNVTVKNDRSSYTCKEKRDDDCRWRVYHGAMFWHLVHKAVSDECQPVKYHISRVIDIDFSSWLFSECHSLDLHVPARIDAYYRQKRLANRGTCIMHSHVTQFLFAILLAFFIFCFFSWLLSFRFRIIFRIVAIDLIFIIFVFTYSSSLSLLFPTVSSLVTVLDFAVFHPLVIIVNIVLFLFLLSIYRLTNP